MNRIRNIAIVALALIALTASTAHAQTGSCPTTGAGTFVVNPSKGCFKANATMHAQNDPLTGLPLVVRYDLEFFDEATNVTTGTPIQTSSIGKPTLANADGSIWFGTGTPNPLPSYPVGRRLKIVVIAVGQPNVSTSSPREVGATSNPFGKSGPATVLDAPVSVTLQP